MSVSDAARFIRCLALLFVAGILLPACTTDLTIDASLRLGSAGEATMRFAPVPPVGTIDLRNTGPDRARLEFFGPSPDHPATLDRMLTVELGAGGSITQSIEGVQRIEATNLGTGETTVIYSIRTREGVGYTIDFGPGASGDPGKPGKRAGEATVGGSITIE